jgi:hypothetical protein
MSQRSELKALQVWVEHVHINDEGQPVIGAQPGLLQRSDKALASALVHKLGAVACPQRAGVWCTIPDLSHC